MVDRVMRARGQTAARPGATARNDTTSGQQLPMRTRRVYSGG